MADWLKPDRQPRSMCGTGPSAPPLLPSTSPPHSRRQAAAAASAAASGCCADAGGGGGAATPSGCCSSAASNSTARAEAIGDRPGRATVHCWSSVRLRVELSGATTSLQK
eukprot:16621-Chlamydomonas_euryale.AAC.7